MEIHWYVPENTMVYGIVVVFNDRARGIIMRSQNINNDLVG